MSGNDFSSQMINSFLGASEFADEVEDLEYYPAGGGGPRSFKAFVKRRPPAHLTKHANAGSTVIEIECANDATSGIASSELDVGGDKIFVALRKGGTATQRPISQVLSQDAGALVLEVR